MSRLTSTILCLLTANVLLGIVLLGGSYFQGSPNDTLRLAGTVDGGGYRLVIKGQYSSDDIGVLKQRLKARLEALDQQLSHDRRDSDVSRLAMSAPLQVISLAPPLRAILSQLNKAHALSGGRFSPYLATPLTAWWLHPNQCMRLDQRFIPVADGKHDALFLGNYLVPLLPITLNIGATRSGLALDALADEMQRAHIEVYRLEVNGQLRGGKGHWPINMGEHHVALLGRRSVMHGMSQDGRTLWVFAPSGLKAATELNALTALDTRAAQRLARKQGMILRTGGAASP